MLPIYISYFAGGGERTPGKTLKGALGFVTGFTVVFVTLGAAVFVGVSGYAYLNAPGNEALLTQFNAIGDAERIFMFMSSTLLPAVIAGIVLCAILAAIMSTADSQLLVTASAVTADVFTLIKKRF